ncbi:MAG: hypothetical protein GXY14_13700 [Spirochaetes bacterium]|nr:hypothetical protein [Spirochaetota bacterium]
MLKKFIFSCLIILAGIDAYAKFTAFERMNDLFFDEGYIEFEYNFYGLESKSGFADTENFLRFYQFDEMNTSSRSLHELSFSASNYWEFSLLVNILSNQLTKLDKWNKGYSINRYNVSLLYDVVKIKGETRFYRIGAAYEYLNFHFSNPAAVFTVEDDNSSDDYTGKQSFDFITHDTLLYLVVAWPKWGDASNLYITLRGGPSWLKTHQETMSIIYEEDPYPYFFNVPAYSLITTGADMKNRGISAGFGIHYIAGSALLIFMDVGVSSWVAPGQGGIL